MRFHYCLCLGSLVILKVLINCAEVPTATSLLNIPSVLLHVITGYYNDISLYLNLESASHHFQLAFSTYPLKELIKRRFKVPELVTDEVSYNEKELKCLLPYVKFAKNNNHIYNALKHDFLHRDKFHVLIPNLIKFFDRIDPKRHRYDELRILIRHKKLDTIFENQASLFNDYTSMMLYSSESVHNIQEYVTAYPETMNYIREYFNRDLNVTKYHYGKNENFLKWVKQALISGISDDIFLTGFPEILVILLKSESSIWTKMFVPRERFLEFFHRLAVIINDLPFETLEDKEYIKLLNTVRFGPEDPNIYDEKIKPKSYTPEKLLTLCHCASLGFKMDLFMQLLPEILPHIKEYPNKLDNMVSDSDPPLQLHKFLFDVHSFSDLSFRESIYGHTGFIGCLLKYYRIHYFEWNGINILIVFQTSPEAVESGFPKDIGFNFVYDNEDLMLESVRSIPFIMKFENVSLFVKFIVECFTRFPNICCFLNAENLNLILKSESTCQLLHEIVQGNPLRSDPLFKIYLDLVLKVLDDPVPTMIGIISVSNSELSGFKSFEQLERLERLTGCQVSSLMSPDFEYFRYRLVFKYIVKTGQDLPTNLPRFTEDLVKLDK